ncbi:MAG: hypothetical protein MAG458_00585 [Nitrosopumilus sp.]|nr:hypothetical protein [Nitrosopumilus sp.]
MKISKIFIIKLVFAAAGMTLFGLALFGPYI